MIGATATVLSPVAGYVLLAIFSVLWVALGIFWGRRAKSYDGYAVAGRNVGLALGTATAVATWITSNTTMLAPQFALQLGVWGSLAYATASFGLFAFAPMSGRIREVMPEGYTAVEFIRGRYGLAGFIPFLIISLFYALTWLISMAMAGGKLLNVLSGIPYPVGMTVVVAVCVLYTLFGGMFAVIGTDFIQSIIILVGLIVVSLAVLTQVNIEEIHTTLQVERPMLLAVFFPAALMALFNNMLFGFGEIFHSNVWWSRAFAMREGVGPKAYFLGGLLWLPVPIVAGFLGLAAPALGIGVTEPDTVGPLVAAELLGTAGALLVFVVVFCSLASSIDSLLAATSDLVVNDIVEPVFFAVRDKSPPQSTLEPALAERFPEVSDAHAVSDYRSADGSPYRPATTYSATGNSAGPSLSPEALDHRKRRWASFSVIGLGLLAWSVALPNVGTLATVLFFAGPMVGSCIWPILGGLYWRRASPIAASSAMIAGSILGLIGYFTIGYFAASLIGAAVSGIIFGLLTWLLPDDFDFRRLAARDPAATSGVEGATQ